MATLENAIEEFKREHGFSDEAWGIFLESVGQVADLEVEVKQLTKRVTRLERQSGRCECMNCIVIGI